MRLRRLPEGAPEYVMEEITSSDLFLILFALQYADRCEERQPMSLRLYEKEVIALEHALATFHAGLSQQPTSPTSMAVRALVERLWGEVVEVLDHDQVH